MDIRPADVGEREAIVALWNRSFGRTHPLETSVLEARLAHHHDPELLLLAHGPRGRPLGFVLGRLPEVPWSAPGLAFVSALAVLPEVRRRGVGSRLYRELSARLAARGGRRLSFGADPNHLLPGVPLEAPPATWRFLRRHGATLRGAEFDLHLDLRPALPEVPLAPGLRLVDDAPDAALAFLDRVFPGRWRAEVEGYLAEGCTVLTLLRGARPVGMSAVFLPNDRYRGPSLYWRRALAGPVAGLGPIGLDPDERGQGQGLALFVAAAGRLRAHGAADLVVNWTTLTGFYGRAGARIWRAYQRADAPLQGDA